MSLKDLSTWESHEALEECIRRDSSQVARAVNMSLSLIQKWKEQPFTDEDYTQSGTRNPLDRLESIIAAIEKIDPGRAYIPIYWLCARFRFANPIKMPEIRGDEDIHEALLAWTKEFGESAQVVSQALQQKGKVGKAICKDILREMMEDMAAGISLLEAIKQKYRKQGDLRDSG